MPTDTPDQQLTMPIGADVADNPSAFANAVADFESRLVREYLNEADRTARMLVLRENNVSALASEDRLDVWNGAAHVSLYRRSLYSMVVKAANQTLTQNSTVNQDVTGMGMAVPAAGAFSFRGVLYYDATINADIRFAFTFPAGGTIRWTGLGVIPGGASTGDATFVSVTVNDSVIGFGANGIGSVLACHIQGDYTAGGTAGTLQLRAAQNAAELTNTTVYARSRLEMWRHA